MSFSSIVSPAQNQNWTVATGLSEWWWWICLIFRISKTMILSENNNSKLEISSKTLSKCFQAAYLTSAKDYRHLSPQFSINWRSSMSSIVPHRKISKSSWKCLWGSKYLRLRVSAYFSRICSTSIRRYSSRLRNQSTSQPSKINWMSKNRRFLPAYWPCCQN